MKKNNILLLIIIGLFIYGCSKEDVITDFVPYKNEIKSVIEQNELLKDFESNLIEHILNFEKAVVKIPVELVSNITSDLDNWKTKVTLSNNEVLEIPTIGTSIDNFIVNTNINPSGYNPLSAKVVLNLPTLGKVSIIVHSKEGAKSPNIEYQFKSIEKGQTIPIIGLYPDHNNRTTIIYSDTDGKERARSTIHIDIKKLSVPYLPTSLVVKELSTNRTEPGMNLISSPGESEADTSIPYMVDTDGNIRWVLDWSNSPILKGIGAQGGVHRMKNGNYIVGDGNNHLLAEVDILGEVINKWDLAALGYTYHHEVSEASNGNLLVAVTKNSAKLSDGSNSRIYDHIIELSPNKGIIEKEWDLANMLDSTRYFITDPNLPGAAFGQSKSNWLHNNAISTIKDGYLANARFHGPFMYSVDGSLHWVIAPHKNWKPKYNKHLLSPLKQNGDPITNNEIINGDVSSDEFEWSWGSHSPVQMPNGNILVFDNGYGRNYNLGNINSPNLYSRAVEYEVNEKNMTVKQVWQYGKERGRECYAPAMSNVQYLYKTGNRLFCPGIAVPLGNGAYGGRVIEIDAETKEVVFELEIGTQGGTAFHRAYRINLYPEGL